MKGTSNRAGTILVKKGSERSRDHARPLSKVLVDKIINIQDENGIQLFQKYSTENILFNMEKHHIQIVELFSKYLKDGFHLLEFIRFFLNILPHHYIQNLHMTIGLIDLFRQITMETHRQRVVLKDITDYMCEKILKKDRNFNKIEAKFIPFNKCFKPSQQRKQYMQISPVIYGETDEKIHKLCQKSIKTDSSKHSRAIIKSQFCYQLKRIFILDALSESISVFDENCSLNKKISPQLSKLKKQVIILSFAFSKRQYRIGAVLKDFSLKFWDHFNNFEYQKSISTTSICQNLQTNIYFLEYFNIWMTTDKTGTINFWNLLEEKPDRIMKCKYNAPINGVCQISSLNLLVVVQECKRSSKLLVEQDKCEGNGSEATVVIYDYFNGQIVTEINLQGMRIPHTLLYSETYQVLFMSGLEKRIKIYDLHPIYMDASLKGQLIGHESLITCFTLISSTPMLISADDKGKVKLWDYRNYICLQTIDFSDKTVITNILDMIEIGKIGIFGSRVNYIDFEDRYVIMKKRNEEESLKIQSIDFDPHLMEMYIFVDRTFRVIDLVKGQVKHIFSYRNQPSDEDYTAFRYFAGHKRIVLGKTNGEVSVYSGQTGDLETVLKTTHEGAVNMIQYDQFNQLYLTVGYDSKMLVHRASDGSLMRQFKNNFANKEINCVQLSVYHNMIAIGSQSSQIVYIWNYQFCKMMAQIHLNAQTPTVLHIINGFGLLVIATNQGNLYLVKTQPNSSDVEVELVDRTAVGKNVVNVYSDVRLSGVGKNTNCTSCKLLVFCEGGEMIQLGLTSYLAGQNFRLHCKEKANYNPYRQCKENFISEVHKLKHTVYRIPQSQEQQKSKYFKLTKSHFTNFSSLSICKMLKMQQIYHVTIGNDKRIKIWNGEYNLLCDYNLKYCLPYKWNIQPTSKTVATQKIYYGVKVLQTISKKYENDISIGEAKNLEVKELFHHLQRPTFTQTHNRAKMITEPEDTYHTILEHQKSQITLLQNEFSRKDLNMELVKKFNFTEVAGPTLKELDNIKKIQNLQKEWKIKEQKQMKQKQSLLKNIESKAKKNQQKDEIQMLFVKNKKTMYNTNPHPQKEQNQKIQSLNKKLTAIENRSHSQDKKPFINTFYKSVFQRYTHKIDPDKIQLSEGKVNKPGDGKSFEQYYKDKFKVENSGGKKNDKFGFREILTQMNGRVNSIKKFRYRKERGASMEINKTISMSTTGKF